MKSKMKAAFAACVALALSACGASNMIVLEPNKTPMRADNVELVYDASTVGVPEEAIAKTKQFMEERFFRKDKAVFKAGAGGVTVKYGFIGYKEGSRMSRYFLGGLGNGAANMVLRASFYGPDGAKLSEAQSTGEIGSGFFGGSHESAIKKAVNEIGNYAEATYR